MKDLISVVVPIYNVERFLPICIESIISQSYKKLQIILVDDGSTDNCGNICNEYASRDERLEVIHKQNGGLSDARNVGINKAKGEYIAFVDSDNYIEKSMYKDMYNLIDKRKADVCICNFYNVEGNNKILKNPNKGIQEYDKISILKEILLDTKIQSYAWNKLYKKEVFNNIKYPVGRKYEDIGTTFYILEKCNKIIVTGKPEYYYLNRKDSIVNNVNEQTIIDYIELIIKRYDYIEKNLKELDKYNKYYLAKTLITAYYDIKSLKDIKSETQKLFDKLYEKVRKNLESDGKEFIDYLSEEQKIQIKRIFN